MRDVLVAIVVLPMVAAILPPVVARFRPRSGWPITALALALHAALTLQLTRLVVTLGRISYAVGGITPPFGIELVADGITVPFLLLVAAVSLGLLAYTRVGGPRSNPFYSLYLLLVAGLTGICVTGDLFTLYVFLEIGGIAAYALVARTPGGEAAIAALKYLLIGTIGATFYLLGVGYIYVATGTLNIDDVAIHLSMAGYDSPLVVAAFAFMVIGLGIKVALVPLHTWLPGAHSKAPVAVSVLLSGLVTSVAAYADIRLILTVFTPSFFDAVALANDALLLSAAASVLYGGIMAVRETKVKRVLAYSTIAQLGIAVLGLGLLGRTGMTGAIVHLVGHGVMKSGLFLAAGCLTAGYGATTVSDYSGLGRREPLIAGSFAILALGMVGVPPTVGLVGKWYVALGAIQTGYWPVAGLVFVSTLLSLAVFGPLLHQLYFTDPGSSSGPASEPHTESKNNATGTISFGMKTLTATAALATLVLGFSAPYVSALLAPVLEVL